MMSMKNIIIYSSLFLFLASYTGCKPTSTASTDTTAPVAKEAVAQEKPMVPMEAADQSGMALPVRYQSPSYMVDLQSEEEFAKEEEATLKVGASIRSTRGPQPLWDILKRLAALKKMNVSWASDVDQNVLVDVDISANDDFYNAIDNLLRQVDYFHEMQGNTIVVKYKETRRFHVAMPFTKQTYKTGTGGNVLGSDELSNNVEGTIELKSSDNEFDIWKNIQQNMDAIINTWNTSTVTPTPQAAAAETDSAGEAEPASTVATRNISTGGSMYIIDKPIGMVTVTAPRPLLERIDDYFHELKRQLYKQITIEAKIIEVELNDSSSIGINWTTMLRNLSIEGDIIHGLNGLVYPYIFSNENGTNSSYGYNDTGTDYDTYSDINAHQDLHDPGRFISSFSLESTDFQVFLNALKTQGDTQILSNPKISVMNGQPALISVGRNLTYISEVEVTEDDESGDLTYAVDTERIMSGVGLALTATVLDDNQIIMNLVPVTSELIDLGFESFGGDAGARVGLPVVAVREMSTTVKVNDGEMLVIGGLISNNEQKTGEFAPILGNIPLVRYLFGHEDKESQKRELIILLKPRII